MSLKVYIHLQESGLGFTDKTSKIQVPKSWSSKTVKDLIQLFLKSYESSFPGQLSAQGWDIDSLHFEREDGTKLYSNDSIEAAIEDRVDYYVRKGVHIRESSGKLSGAAAEDANLTRCRNYGCNKFFKEEENTEDACQHHTGPPIFHDTMKCWSCCKDVKKAYDFESFQLILGCNRGRHSAVAKTVAIADSPNAVQPNLTTTSGVPAPPPLKSIESYNSENPLAASAASSAAKSLVRKSSRKEDGSAKCQRKGCQKTFLVTDNSLEACLCVYHKGQPIFHDAVKFWSCCPEKKCFDFDEFLAVPGCGRGVHDDGEVALELL